MSDSGTTTETTGLEIAIIGMSGRFPGARSLDEYWQNLRSGVESITFFSDEDLRTNGVESALLDHPDFVRAGVVLEGTDEFDAALFDLTPREAEILDPQHRLFLECAWEALENAGYDSEKFSGLIGVYAGARRNTYLAHIQSHPDLMASVGDYQANLANNLAYVPTRVSYKLNLRGPSVSVQTACSTSLVAVHLACQGLLSGECEIALAGGVAVNATQKEGYLHQPGMIFSPDGHCRAFDVKAKGTISGNGTGIVVLKRLEEALEDGDTVCAIIKGTAINNDGNLKLGFTAPSINGQARVIRAAQTMAEVDAETISYVEAHGTATELGDPIEVAALTKAFSASTQRKGFCALGSVKSNLGHLSAAAGVAGLIKTVLALQHKQLPPSLHFEKPNPKIDFEGSPFFVNTGLREWERGETPRRAGVSSFGMGGTNAHAIVEEASPATKSGPSRPWQLLLLSAKTPSAVDRMSDNLLEHLIEHPEVVLGDVAFTLKLGRKDLPQRRALMCRDREDAIQLLQHTDAKRVLNSTTEPKQRPAIFIFPGQGSQYVNMGLELYRAEPVFRKEIDACAEILTPILGLDLRYLLFPKSGGEEQATQQLNDTLFTQSALFALEYSLAMLFRDWGIEPRAMIGHSIGEYVAACLSGVFGLEEGLSLVAARGRLMHNLPAGAMMAVSLPEEKVSAHLDQELSLAAVNGPALCVVSGPKDSLEQFEAWLHREGCEGRHLHTSHAFHSAMMDPILKHFAHEVGRITLQAPKIPFASNVTGTWITDEQAVDPAYWTRHLRNTVRFSDDLKSVSEREPDAVFLEVGPGRTLNSFVSQHRGLPPARRVFASMRHPKDDMPDLQVLLTTLGQLWLSGIRVDWSRFYSREDRRRVPLPTYPFERKRYWVTRRVATGDDHPERQGESAALRVYTPSWKRSSPLWALEWSAPATDRHWLLFVDDCGLGSQVAANLRELGHTTVIVEAGRAFKKISDSHFVLDPGSHDGYSALVESLRENNRPPNALAHFWSVTRRDLLPLSIDRFDRCQMSGFLSLLFLAEALKTGNVIDPIEINIISTGMQEVAGESLDFPEKASILGLCRKLQTDNSNVICRSIDVSLPQSSNGNWKRLVNRLTTELGSGSDDHVIALRGRHRWVQTFESVRLHDIEPGTSRLREGGVYLITNALTDMGLAWAEFLVETVQARLILIDDQIVPDREHWREWLREHGDSEKTMVRIKTLERLEKQGSELLLQQANLADTVEVEEAVKEAVRRFGNIHGVIHPVSDGATTRRAPASLDQVKDVLRSRARELFALKQIVHERDFDFVLLVSPVATFLGHSKHSLDTGIGTLIPAFVQSQGQAQKIAWMSVSYHDPCREQIAGATALDRARISEAACSCEGYRAIAERIFAVEGANQLFVSPQEVNDWACQPPRTVTASETVTAPDGEANAPTSVHSRPAVPKHYVGRNGTLQSEIADTWQELLGIDHIDIHDNFFELGGDSLLGTQFVNLLRARFKVEVPLRLLFEHPTIEDLANQIEVTCHPQSGWLEESP